MDLLLAAKANVNMINDARERCLGLATGNGSLGVVKLLLSRKADVNATSAGV